MSHPDDIIHQLQSLGIPVHWDASGNTHTTCPECSHTRRKSRDRCLSVNVDTGVWHCWHCGYKGGVSSRHTGTHTPPPPPKPRSPDEKKRWALHAVWNEAAPLTHEDPVMAYLAGRGIVLAQTDLPTSLRFHAQLRYYATDGRPYTTHPGMVARIDDPSGHMVSVHRTYLSADGYKAATEKTRKLMTPTLPGATVGGAIRLYPAGEVLAVTEGIETALAVHLMTGLPTWSAMCAGSLGSLVVPDAVRLVVIAADHDKNGVGLHGAQELARRLLAEGRSAKILLPERPGTDWADLPHTLTLQQVEQTQQAVPDITQAPWHTTAQAWTGSLVTINATEVPSWH
jgi:hypothetical protein